jgi:hypothetical protein
MNGDTMEELYAALTQTRKDRDEARWLNRVLTTERDVARRMYCEHQLLFHNPNKQKNYHELTALENNWDCYNQEVDRDFLSQEVSQEQWDSLNEELWDRRLEMTEMKVVIATLHRERDEARRLYCELCDPSPQWLAKEKDWDCYKETT